MLYPVFFVTTAVLFALFLTFTILKSLKENDVQDLVALEEQIKEEKAQAQFYKKEYNRYQDHRSQIDQKLLKIRLDVVILEDDMKDLFPRLLN